MLFHACNQKEDGALPRTNKVVLFVRALAFLLIFAVVFVLFGNFFQPLWPEWNTYDRTYGFYEELEDTIETVFLGSSVMIRGIVPMELYDNYGICSYNLASEQQPAPASYYWLKETYRLHGKTLKNVVLDVSMLRRDGERSFYQKAIDGMAFSSNKISAVQSYTDTFNEAISYSIPLFEYHSRWDSLSDDDFEKASWTPDRSLRGYSLDFINSVQFLDESQFYYPDLELAQGAEPLAMDAKAMEYLQQMVDFCRENQLNFILIKTPQIGWNSAAHQAVQQIADENQLTFLDFNFNPLFDALEFNFVLDTFDSNHMDYYGALKLTDWLGNYLTENYPCTDVRTDARFDFMQDQLEQYDSEIKNEYILRNIENPVDYLAQALAFDHCTVFIAAKDEAAGALSQDMRDTFGNMGLSKLRELKYRDSYLAVIENGTVVAEESEHFDETDPDSSTAPLTYTGSFEDGEISYSLTSGGIQMGDVASCVIDGAEYALNTRGLNVIVYDHLYNIVIDSVTFDTCASSITESRNMELAFQCALSRGEDYEDLSEDLQTAYRYNLRLRYRDMAKNLETEGNYTAENFLRTYAQEPDVVIFITRCNTTDQPLSGIPGAPELPALAAHQSLLEIVSDGKVVYQSLKDLSEENQYDFMRCACMIRGNGAGTTTSIQIKGTEYAAWTAAFQMVVYHPLLDEVIDTFSLDAPAA